VMSVADEFVVAASAPMALLRYALVAALATRTCLRVSFILLPLQHLLF